MKISPPAFEELNDYYQSYWKYLKDDDLLSAITSQQKSTTDWISSLPSNVENLAYADGKWMLKEVIGHMCDTERILSYRALRFARNDKTSLPGFDENDFMDQSNFKNRSLKEIGDEWKSIRSATISLFSSMTDEILDRKGRANGTTVTPRILLYFILAHERHHLNVIKERYLSKAVSA